MYIHGKLLALTLRGPTPQNGQTHWKYLSTVANELLEWVNMWVKGFMCHNYSIVPKKRIFLSFHGKSETDKSPWG